MSCLEIDFEQVYEKYYIIIYRYLLKLTKDKHIAEEITQETFFKALKSINKYNSDMKMLTWLCTIAKNTFFSEIKKQRRCQVIDENQGVDEEDIIDCLITEETNLEILKTIHQLEEPYKEVFILRTFASFSFLQIANMFEKSESWARVTYFRSKIKLKEKLDYDKL